METKDAIAITDEIARRRLIGKCLNKLLTNPLCSRVFGHIEVNHFPPIMSQNEENIENTEPNGGHSDEIDGDKFPAMIFQERPPRLRRRFGLPRHVFGNGCLRDIDTKFEEFPREFAVHPKADFFCSSSGSGREPPWRFLAYRHNADSSKSKTDENHCGAMQSQSLV